MGREGVRTMKGMTIKMIAVSNNRKEWQFREYRALHIDVFLTREDGTACHTIIILFNKKYIRAVTKKVQVTLRQSHDVTQTKNRSN